MNATGSEVGAGGWLGATEAAAAAANSAGDGVGSGVSCFGGGVGAGGATLRVLGIELKSGAAGGGGGKEAFGGVYFGVANKGVGGGLGATAAAAISAGDGVGSDVGAGGLLDATAAFVGAGTLTVAAGGCFALLCLLGPFFPPPVFSVSVLNRAATKLKG